eukprot:gene2166-25395_t
MSAYPFEDEVSFKAWQNEATKAKPPRGVKPPPPPSDSDAPSAEEIAMTAKLESLVRPELKDGLRDGMATRFIRGYALRSYVNAPDRIERTAHMLNLTLEWRKSVDASNLVLKELPSRAEWDKLGPQCFPGSDADGRVLYYMLFPEDLTKIPLENAKKCHFQDMLRLEEVKANASNARKAQGLPIRHHHVLILDLGNPNNAMSRSLLNWFKEVVTHPKGPSITQHFFPDMLERAVIINAPFYVRALWSVAKLFMEAVTAEKYQITGGSYESTLKDVGVSRSVLPMSLGGNGTNAPGVETTVKVAKASAEQVTLNVPAGATSVSWTVKLSKGTQCEVNFKCNGQSAGHSVVDAGSPIATGSIDVAAGGAGQTTATLEIKGSASGGCTVSLEIVPTMPAPWFPT